MNTLISLLAETAIKGTVLLAAATILVLAWRRASAARRYAVWFFALAGLLVLPFLGPWIPGFEVLPRAAIPEEWAAAPIPPSEVVAEVLETTGVAAAGATAESAGRTPYEGTPGSSAAERGDGAYFDPEFLSGPASAVEAVSPPTSRSVWLSVAFWVWLGGAVLAASPLLFGWLGIRRVESRAKPVVDGREHERLLLLRKRMGLRRTVRLLWGPFGAMPMTWGFGIRNASTILLPAEASRWSDARLDAVLLHELAHVRRRDCTTQFVSRCACALYWFHPWVWIAGNRLLVERERACDDEVLRHSASPADYARDLVDVAAGADASHPAARAAIAMARPHKLDARLRAIMDTRRNRSALTRGVFAGLVLFTALVMFPVASLKWAGEGTADDEAFAESDSEAAVAFDFDRSVLDFRVIEEATGEPIADARIHVRMPEGLRVVESDEPARWLIEHPEVPPSVLSIQVEADGYAPRRAVWFIWRTGEAIPENYTMAMEPGSPIGGRIVDDLGEPIEGATVELTIEKDTGRPNAHSGISFTRVETDEEGWWEYPLAPREFDLIRIGFFHPAYASQWPGSSGYVTVQHEPHFELRDGSLRHVLKRGVPVEGTVYDPRGEPLEGAIMELGPDRVGGSLLPGVPTDSEGRFRLPVHPEEEVVLTIKFPGYAPDLMRFPGDTPPDEIRFDLEPSHRLSGRLVDSSGNPLAGGRVFMDTWRDARSLALRIETNERGEFVWEDAPSDTVLADVWAPGFPSRRQVPIQAGEENTIVVFERPVVRGTVVDAETGEPVRRFSVREPGNWFVSYTPPEPIRWDRGEAVEFDTENGRFEMTLDGSFRLCVVRVEAPGYRATESPIFAIEDGPQEFVFEMEPADWISGRVLGAGGDAALGAEVFLAETGGELHFVDGELDRSRPEALRQETDSDGRFSFPPRTDPFFLFVRHASGYAELSGLPMGDVGDVVLQPWARIEGEAFIRGEPADRYEISSRSVRPRESDRPYLSYEVRTVVHPDGAFVFDRLPAGQARIGRMVRDRTSIRISRYVYQNPIPVDLAPGETRTVRLGGTGRPVVGRVDVDDWEGIDWMAVVANVRTGNGTEREAFEYGFIVSSDGSFRIEDLAPGDYSLQLRFDDLARLSNRAMAGVNHAFTVPEFDGPYSDEPVELPVLQPE